MSDCSSSEQLRLKFDEPNTYVLTYDSLLYMPAKNHFIFMLYGVVLGIKLYEYLKSRINDYELKL